MRIVGSPPSSPDPSGSVTGNGLLEASGGKVTFTGLGAVAVEGAGSLTLVTGGSQDSLSVLPGVGSGGQVANRITGTSDSVDLVPVTFFGVTDVILDTGTHDGARQTIP
jgi:hypothetical protein